MNVALPLEMLLSLLTGWGKACKPFFGFGPAVRDQGKSIALAKQNNVKGPDKKIGNGCDSYWHI